MALTATAPATRLGGRAFAAIAVVLAAGVGLATAEDPRLGAAACLALIALPVALVRPRYVPPVLVVSVFAASMELGTVTVGRLVAPLGMLAVIVYVLQRPITLKNSTGLIATGAGYVVLAFASLMWSVEPRATIDSLLTLSVSVGYAATFAFLIKDEKDLRRLLWVTTFSSLALAMLWITSYATGVDRRFNEAGDPNFFAALQVVSLPLVLVLASTTKNHLHRLFLVGAIAVIAGSIISTLSLGGLITMAAAALIITVLPSSTLFRSRGQKGAFILAALIGLGGLFVVAKEDIDRRLDIKFSQEDAAGGRGDLWGAAIHGYKQRPVTGLGYGGFYASSFQLLRTTPGVDLERHLRFLGLGEYAHNAYIGSLAELGPLGVVLFVGMLLFALRTLWRSAHRAAEAGETFKRAVSNALIVAILSFSVSSFLLSTETSRTLWMLLGLTAAVATMTDYPERRPSGSGR